MAIQQIHTYCAMCISRCAVVATVEDGRLTKVSPDAEHPNGCICVKGTAAPEIVYSPDRLQYPMVRTRPKGDSDPGWARISWDEAMALVASRLLDIKTQHGSEAVVFSRATPAGSASSDFESWLRRLANAFGTPNLMTTTHICNWTRVSGSQYTFGKGQGPSPDYDHARCILLWGFNPQATWPVAAASIGRARRRGAKIIVIDPRKTGMVDKADVWLRVRPGADGVLAMAMIHVLLEEGLYDQRFVQQWTNAPFLVRDDTGQLLTARDLLSSEDSETFFAWDAGGDGPVAHRPDQGYTLDGVVPALSGTHPYALQTGERVDCRPAFELLKELAARFAPERSEEITWVPAAEVRRAARMFAKEQPSCYFTWVGLEQHSDAIQTNRAVCTFYALTGQFDREGSNLLPWAAPMNPVAEQRLLPKEKASRRLGLDERPLGPPRDPGIVQAYRVYPAILTGQPYPIKALVAFGSDPLLANGDPLQGQAALQALDFYVHVDMFANPSASFADMLLPATTCWESEALLPGAAVRLRPTVVEPQGESRPDLDIIFDLAVRLGLGEHFFGGNIEDAFNYQLEPSGITVEQLRARPMGIRVGAPPRFEKHAEIDAHTGQRQGFATPTRKIEIYSTTFARAGYPPLPVFEEPAVSPRPDRAEEFPLVLTFSRLVQFCDEQHRNIPRLRRQAPDPFVEIHPDAAGAAGIEDGEWALLETAMGRIRMKAKLNPALDSRVVATQYGWWQGCQELGAPAYDPLSPEGANANVLISNDVIDPIGGSVPHRSQMCRVRKEA